MQRKILTAVRTTLILLSLMLLISGANLVNCNFNQNLRLITRPYEFNFVNWTVDAIIQKTLLKAINHTDYFGYDSRILIVNDFIENIATLNEIEHSINIIYSDPLIHDPEIKTTMLNIKLEDVQEQIKKHSPIFESVIEEQVGYILSENNIAINNQPFPPLVFHISDPPDNIIISQREMIGQVKSISINSEIGIMKHIEIENEIDENLDVSSLVVPIGGLGSYPTMVSYSSSVHWLINTVTHEWIHNWLYFRPLGRNYGKSYETRTMNETTASIIGNEISVLVLKEFYPDRYLEYLEYENRSNQLGESSEMDEHHFDFNLEMNKTRIYVDQLLSDGKIDEAESYMEERRIVFWNNGYLIRKINQAYFAFYGAYADIPVGAAGNDPVGPAVRYLRDNSESLRGFLFSISKLSSFDELIELLNNQQ